VTANLPPLQPLPLRPCLDNFNKLQPRLQQPLAVSLTISNQSSLELIWGYEHMYVIMGALHTTPCLYLQFNKGNLPSIELYYLIVSRINHKNKDTHITDEETKYALAENGKTPFLYLYFNATYINYYMSHNFLMAPSATLDLLNLSKLF